MRIDNRRNPHLAEVVKEERQERKPLNLDALALFNRVTSNRISKDQLDNAAINFARRQEQEAKDQLDDYMESTQRQKDWDKSVADAMGRLNLTGGNLDLQLQNLPNATQNQKEVQLYTVAQNAKIQAERAEDAALMGADLDQIRSMPQEDRNLLEQYVSGRNEWLDHKAIASSTAAFAELSQKYGDQRVKEMAESYERYRNQQGAQQTVEQTQRQTDTGFLSGVGHSLGSIAANAMGSLTGTLGYFQEALTRTGRYQTLDPNNPGTLPGKYAGTVREEVAENIRGDGKLPGNAAALGYQAIMGAADNAARLVMGAGTPGGSLGLAAMGSFSQTVSEASDQGASPAQAVLLGVSKAGLEVITEKMSLDELLRAGKGGAKSAGQIIRNVLKQGGIEAAEEEIAMLGGIVAEALILREKSGYNQKIGDLVAAGMSYQEAKANANLGLWEEAVNTAAQSLLTGSLMEGGRALLTGPGIGQASQDQPEPQPNDDRAMTQRETVVAKSETTENPQPAQLEAFREASDELLGVRAQENTAQSVNESAGIKQQIQASQETLASMEPVAQINTPREFDGMDLTQKINWVIEKLRPTNYQVDRKGFGVIKFAKKQLRSAFNYFKSGTVEESAFEAIPYVLEHGTEISNREDHKNRGYGTVTFAAPVTIDGRRGNMAVVVKRTSDNFYKVHRILSPDGSVFELQDAEKAGSTMTGESLETSSLAAPKDPASIGIIPNNGRDVNGENAPQGAPEGFEAMGAASRGFSPKYAMIDQYGALPEGENPVRAGQLPASTTGDDRVSLTARTALEAQATPDEFAELIENTTMRGGFSYIPIANNETVQRATAEITAAGWERSRGRWEQQVRNGMTSAEITATGALLYNHAVNAGDFEAAMDILLDYQQAVRNAAQAVQAARILKTLTPDNRLHMIHRSVQRMVEDLHLDTPITIDENLAQQYQQAQTDGEADQILDQIVRDVARQIPSTWAERFTALRYLNMLGNFRTQARNLVGNVTNQAAYLAKDELAATFEALASFVTRGRFQRTKSLVRDLATRNAAAADYDNVAQWIRSGGRTNDRADPSTDFARRVQENRQIFRNPVLEGYRRATNWAMDNQYFGDAAFGRMAYARALAGYLNARGIRTDDLSTVDPQTLDAARKYAVRQAQEATFRDNNQVSTFVSNALRHNGTPWYVRMMGEGIMPFRKTPANVLVRAEEFSPLGLINALVNTGRAAGGQITGAEAVESWAKSLTGTGLFAIGWALANMGHLRGGPDEDEDKAAFDKLNGLQDYAIVLPDGTNLTIDAFSPAALPLLMGAQLEKVLDGDMTWADLEGIMWTIADPMLEMSMLSGLNDTIDAIRYADNAWGQLLVNAGFNYLTQAIGNTLLGQIERSTEGSRMTTYIDKDSNVPPWLQRNLGKLSQKILVWDYQQTPYIDAWGREQQNFKGAANWAYNLTSPSYIDKAEEDAVADTLNRIYEATGDPSVFPEHSTTTITYTDKEGNRHEKYSLSMEETDRFQRIEGQTKRSVVEALNNSEAFQALPPELQRDAVIAAYDYARETAREQVLSGYDGKAAWMKGIEGKEADTIIRRVLNSELSGAMDNLTGAWKNGYTDDSVALEDLEAAYQVYSGLSAEAKRAVNEGLPEKLLAYVQAREAGQTQEELMPRLKVDTLVDAGMDNMAEFIREGTDSDYAATLDQVYQDFKALSKDEQKMILENASGRNKYYLTAREAGVNTETFTDLYGKFLGIQDREDLGETDRAIEWAYTLEKAVEAGQISREQADALEDRMKMFNTIPVGSGKYGHIVDAGFDADTSLEILQNMRSIQGTGKDGAVRTIDEYNAILSMDFLSEEEQDAVMKLYMTDYNPDAASPVTTELKYEYARQEMGLSVREYIDAWNATQEYSKKADIEKAWIAMGFTRQQAAMLWNLFKASGSAKINVVEWWNELNSEE